MRTYDGREVTSTYSDCRETGYIEVVKYARKLVSFQQKLHQQLRGLGLESVQCELKTVEDEIQTVEDEILTVEDKIKTVENQIEETIDQNEKEYLRDKEKQLVEFWRSRTIDQQDKLISQTN